MEPPRRVLVVDDEELVRTFAGHVLAEAGYQVVLAYDGFAALTLVEQLPQAVSLLLFGHMHGPQWAMR